MSKNFSSSSKNALMTRFLPVFVVILFFGFALLAYKHAKLKSAWNEYAIQSLEATADKRDMTGVEDANMVAITVGQFPSGAPLYTQVIQLRAYVSALSKTMGRDIVVMDKNKVIWADTVSANNGKKFMEDKKDEVAKTIADGQARSFIEAGNDYPQGIHQSVVQLKNASGTVVGAVVMSSSQAFK